jgi:hypothetical protein
MADDALIIKLSCNLESEDDKVVCWSLIVLNNVLKIWKVISEDSIKELMPRYL